MRIYIPELLSINDDDSVLECLFCNGAKETPKKIKRAIEMAIEATGI